MFRCLNCGIPGGTCNQQCYYESCRYCGTKGCLATCDAGQQEMRRRREVEKQRMHRESILAKYPINPRVRMLEVNDDDRNILLGR
jgi:hypothetical protein